MMELADDIAREGGQVVGSQEPCPQLEPVTASRVVGRTEEQKRRN